MAVCSTLLDIALDTSLSLSSLSILSIYNHHLSSKHPTLLVHVLLRWPRPIPLPTWVLKVSADESRRFQEYLVLGKSPIARVHSLSSTWPRAPKTLTGFHSCPTFFSLSSFFPFQFEPVTDFPGAKPEFLFLNLLPSFASASPWNPQDLGHRLRPAESALSPTSKPVGRAPRSRNFHSALQGSATWLFDHRFTKA